MGHSAKLQFAYYSHILFSLTHCKQMTQPWSPRNKWAECRKTLALHSNILLLPNTCDFDDLEIFETLARYRMLGKVQGRISPDVHVLRRWAYEQNSPLSFQCAHHNHSQLMAIVNTLVLDTDSQYPW